MALSLPQSKIRLDFLVVVGWILLTIPLVLLIHARFITSTILFFAVPALYLLIRTPKQLPRLGASLLAGMVVAFIVDFLAELNGAWSWAPQGQLVFPDKLFGLVPIDVLIWYFLWLLFIIVFYEHFFEQEQTKNVSRFFTGALSVFVVLLVAMLVVFFLHENLLHFRYAYFFIGLLGAMPLYYVVIRKPHLATKLLKAAVFNMFVFLSFELTALMLDQWRFPGQYLSQINVFGLIIPLEEFVFWIILGAPIILAYYEQFVDDGQ